MERIRRISRRCTVWDPFYWHFMIYCSRATIISSNSTHFSRRQSKIFRGKANSSAHPYASIWARGPCASMRPIFFLVTFYFLIKNQRHLHNEHTHTYTRGSIDAAYALQVQRPIVITFFPTINSGPKCGDAIKRAPSTDDGTPTTAIDTAADTLSTWDDQRRRSTTRSTEQGDELLVPNESINRVFCWFVRLAWVMHFTFDHRFGAVQHRWLEERKRTKKVE